MSDVFVVDAVRTPVGRFQGALSTLRPDDLFARVLIASVQRTGISAEAIDEVFAGCANQAGEDNRNVARMSVLLAGFPDRVPAVTVNRLCASGLEAINQASRMIRVGDADLVLAGGVESMSRAPYSMPRAPQHPKLGNVQVWDTSLGWRYPNPELEKRFPLEAMGETAENLVDRYGISREEQDAFAVQSHQRAVRAKAEGWFEGELVPIETVAGSFDADEGPRSDASVSALAKLKPAFRKGGSVTPGNSSPLNDGAAVLVLASEKAILKHQLSPIAKILSMASEGVDPRVMGIGPVPAVAKALKRAGIEAPQVGAWELNEAFAAQSIAVMRELNLNPEKVNMHGGAIALGHPLGASGARISTTLLSVMKRTHSRFGVATLCVGVGQGVATVFERV